MPLYDYVCRDCQTAAEAIKGSPLTREEMPEVVFETSHLMSPTPEELLEARTCPRCKGINTGQTLMFSNVICYVRGNGYLDRSGCHRDMNLFKLSTTDPDTGKPNDPYDEMRQPGEVDDLKTRIAKAGQHNPKTKTFAPTKSEQKELTKAVEQATSPSSSGAS